MHSSHRPPTPHNDSPPPRRPAARPRSARSRAAPAPEPQAQSELLAWGCRCPRPGHKVRASRLETYQSRSGRGEGRQSVESSINLGQSTSGLAGWDEL